MENSPNLEVIPAFDQKQEKTHDSYSPKGSQTSRRRTRSSLSSSLSLSSPSKRREIMKKNKEQQKYVVMGSKLEEEDENGNEKDREKDEEENDDDGDEIERKILALKRIVPGGHSLGIDKLFEETADYILALQCQIKAMRVLSSFLQGINKEKSKFGG